MIQFLKRFMAWVFCKQTAQDITKVLDFQKKRSPTSLPILRYAGPGDPPPGHWKPCHPSTMHRFKAEMTCPNGHGMTLKGHAVGSDGTLYPSVVCPYPDCNFHEFSYLADWTFGALALDNKPLNNLRSLS